MKKIGILFGMENTFPPALVEKINSMKVDGVTAEFVKLGGVKMADPSGYRVIVDRISQDIPFYRAYLKNAALNGTIVINNPFWWTADDKFFNYALATKLGVAIPPTVTLASQQASRGHYRSVHAQLDLSVELGRDFRVRRLPCFPETILGRRLEARLQGALAGGILPSLQPDRRSVHDFAAWRRVQGIFPLLCGRAGESADHVLRSESAIP